MSTDTINRPLTASEAARQIRDIRHRASLLVPLLDEEDHDPDERRDLTQAERLLQRLDEVVNMGALRTTGEGIAVSALQAGWTIDQLVDCYSRPGPRFVDPSRLRPGDFTSSSDWLFSPPPVPEKPFTVLSYQVRRHDDGLVEFHRPAVKPGRISRRPRSAESHVLSRLDSARLRKLIHGAVELEAAEVMVSTWQRQIDDRLGEMDQDSRIHDGALRQLLRTASANLARYGTALARHGWNADELLAIETTDDGRPAGAGLLYSGAAAIERADRQTYWSRERIEAAMRHIPLALPTRWAPPPWADVSVTVAGGWRLAFRAVTGEVVARREIPQSLGESGEVMPSKMETLVVPAGEVARLAETVGPA